MRLFTVGPVQMRKEIMEVGGMQVPYFRTAEFSNVMLDSDALLHKFMNAGHDAKSIYLTASGTGALEATVINCLNAHDKVLIINGGTFGQRFVDICKIHSVPYIEIKLHKDEKLTGEHLKKYNNVGITALLVNINETSTGQLYDVKMLANFCRCNDVLFIVDAISSYLIDEYDMAGNGIDATIISSQKGLCIAPGLSVVVLSNKIIKARVGKNTIHTLYFDFNTYLENFKRGQTPYTPCVGICMEMNKALHMIDNQGIKKWLNNIDVVAKNFRENLKKLPISIPVFPLGNAVTPIIFERAIAKLVFNKLKDEYGIFVNPTGGDRENYVLRVAHIGDTTVEDNRILIEKLEKVIKEVG